MLKQSGEHIHINLICIYKSNYKLKRKFATLKQVLQAGVGVFKPFIFYIGTNIINFL